jgi:pilus assembly protein Flp/PilA
MLAIWCKLRTLRSDDRGASIVEYALLIALISIVVLLVVATLGKNTSTSFSSMGAGFP